MKKLGIASLICFSLFFAFAQNAYANDFKIRSGLENTTNVSQVFSEDRKELHERIDFFAPYDNEDPFFEILMNVISNSEVTFDRFRTIIGSSSYGTEIRFVAFNTEIGFHFDEWVTVGNSGVFSIDVPLEEGHNIILIISKSHITEAEINENLLASMINRLPLEIREILSERTRSLTNSGVTTYEY
jgi:hypothetical protein